MRKRVFISHRAKSDASSKILDLAEQALIDEGYDVFVDRSFIEKGDDIAAEVHDFLANCHAAVMLVSEEVFDDESIWVPVEAAKLAERNEDLDEFLFLPVFVSPMTADALSNNKLKPANIHNLNGIDSEPLDTFPERLAGALSRLKDPSPQLDALARDIATDLEPVKDRQRLTEALELLGRRLQRRHGLRVLRELTACELLRSKIDVVVEALKKARVPCDQSMRIFEMISPMWIDGDIIDSVQRATAKQDDPQQQATLVADGSRPSTGHMIVKRASCQFPHWSSAEVHCATGENADTEIEQQIIAALHELDEFQHISVGDLKIMLKMAGPPVFAVLQIYDPEEQQLGLPMPGEVLNSVRGSMPNRLILLALAGPDDVDTVCDELVHAEPIRLGLSQEAEQLGFLAIQQSFVELRKFHPN